MHLNDEEKEYILHSSLDDSTKIIQYLEQEKKSQNRFNIKMLIITLFGAVGSILAAVFGILLFFQ